jgi:hypothetical protein
MRTLEAPSFGGQLALIIRRVRYAAADVLR